MSGNKTNSDSEMLLVQSTLLQKDKRKYKCGICNKRFAREMALKNHKNIAHVNDESVFQEYFLDYIKKLEGLLQQSRDKCLDQDWQIKNLEAENRKLTDLALKRGCSPEHIHFQLLEKIKTNSILMGKKIRSQQQEILRLKSQIHNNESWDCRIIPEVVPINWLKLIQSE